MLIIFKELTKQFEQSLLDSLEKNDKKGEFEILRKNLITQSSKEEFGDYQCNVCLSLSKIYKKKPRDISNDFINLLNKNKNISKLCKSLEIAGPGFINIKIKDEVLINEIKSGYFFTNASIAPLVIECSPPSIIGLRRLLIKKFVADLTDSITDFESFLSISIDPKSTYIISSKSLLSFGQYVSKQELTCLIASGPNLAPGLKEHVPS